MVSDVKDMLMYLLRRIYGPENIISGSQAEREEAERIVGILEDYLGVTAKVRFIPSNTWVLKELSIHPHPPEAYATFPYVETSTTKGRLFRVSGNPVCEESWRNFPEDNIALVREPRNPDDLKLVVINAYRAGASGVVVESTSAPRVIVVNSHKGFSYSAGSPVDIPVVIVNEGYSSRLGDSHIEIEIQAETRESESSIVEVDMSGGRDLVIVGAHIDRWFKGALDNVLGIAQAIVASKILSDKGYHTKLVLFGSEEFGSPGYASWYWAWGSRFYASQLWASGLWRDVKTYINFDTAGFKPLQISGSPQYTGMSQLNLRCCETPETDSFSFASIGVPTISLHSMWSKEFKEIYHTPNDSIDVIDLDLASLAVNEAIRLVSQDPSFPHMEKMILSMLGDGPLEARRLAYVILSLASRVGWDLLYPELARRFLKPILFDYGCEKDTDLEATWFPEISSYVKILHELREGSPPSEVWIVGDERLIYKTKSLKGKTMNAISIAEQARSHLKKLWLEVEDLQRELVA